MTQPLTTAGPDGHEDDQALARAVHSKDRKATAEFVQQYTDSVYGYILARLRSSPADADDLTQEVFLAACRGIGEYRAASSLKGWLLGIARHKIEDYYRARLRETELDEADAPTTDAIEVDSALDRARVNEQVVSVLSRLPEQHRLLLQWRYWDQRRTDEIAAALDRTPKAVERLLARARERFRREWEAQA